MESRNLLPPSQMLMRHHNSSGVLLSLTVKCSWSMKKETNSRLFNYRFIEVGLLVNGFEFYHEFCIPVNLSMRRFNDKAKRFDPVPVEDWLTMDFPTILRRKLFALNPSCSIEVYSIRNIFPHQRPLAPIVRGDSLSQTWCDTFIYLIASYFVNNYHYETKKL